MSTTIIVATPYVLKKVWRCFFIGNGLPVDDISSGSSSQVCMMSMIINLVLLHQASTKFNIEKNK